MYREEDTAALINKSKTSQAVVNCLVHICFCIIRLSCYNVSLHSHNYI